MLIHDQEVLRKKLLDYLNITGTKACIISQRLNIPQSLLSQFKNGKRDLYPNLFNKLDKYLNSAKNNIVSCTINKTYLK